ncbi:Farnesyl diphosphate synthase 3, partial [Operophtera brumata]
MMDSAMPCWYRLPNVGLGAINDSILIHCSIYETLQANFSKTPLYVDIVELFNEYRLPNVGLGAINDSILIHCLIYETLQANFSKTPLYVDIVELFNKSDYSMFTIDRYYSIVKHKTSYYTFKLPVSLGYLLANNADKNTHKKVEEVCLDLGKLFQIQVKGKCSWLAVNALKHCDETQRATFVEHYANKDPANVDTIKRLYQELRIPDLYKNEERIVYEGILQK